MKFSNPLIVTADLALAKQFYQEVLGLSVVLDFGANVTLDGGISLQTLDTWKDFIGTEDITFYPHSSELYFVEEDFDGFLQRLSQCEIQYVHPMKEHRWGQRVVRFYDTDGHIIEVGESLAAVCRRFQAQDMTHEEIALRMDVPLPYVLELLA